MNRTIELKNAMTALFRSGADREHNANEMVELLDGIDFLDLLQSVCNDAEIVYQYHACELVDGDFHYFGPDLLPQKATLLYQDFTDVVESNALCRRALELWLLPDMRFAVLSCFTVATTPVNIATEYRTLKGCNWKEAGMEIDFLALADDLAERCEKVRRDEPPLFEV